MTRSYADTPFANYAREHGFPKLSQLPGSIGKMLSAKPKKIAPNSPMLAELAKFMKRPLSELQAFAKGPPMGEKWVNKIRSQIEHGTIPDGRPKPGKRRSAGPRATPLGELLANKGWTASKLAAEIGVKPNMIWKASMGVLAPNHPLLPEIAKALGEPLGKLAAMQDGKPLKPGMLLKTANQLGIPLTENGGKGLVLSSIEHGPGRENGKNGNGKHPKGKYGPQNRLGSKRTDAQLRQSIRALISTVNVAVMKGDTHIPPIPVADMYAILRDYVQEKGIKAEVLIDPRFAELFDPR